MGRISGWLYDEFQSDLTENERAAERQNKEAVKGGKPSHVDPSTWEEGKKIWAEDAEAGRQGEGRHPDHFYKTENEKQFDSMSTGEQRRLFDEKEEVGDTSLDFPTRDDKDGK